MPLLQFVSSEYLDTFSSGNEICDYFRDRVQCQSPEQVLQAFIALTQDKKDFPDQKILATLEKLTEDAFHRVLNHCCQILISHWYQQQPNPFIIAALFHHLDTFAQIAPRNASRPEKWTRNFVKSSTYLPLKRVMNPILGDLECPIVPIPQNTLENLLPRYPFLYKYSFLNLDAHPDYLKMLSLLRKKKRQHFSAELTKFAIYRIRLLQILKARQLTQGAGRLLRPVTNPTLLSDQQINDILYRLANTAQSTPSYQSQAFTAIELLNYLFRDLIEYSTQDRQRQFIQSLFVHLQSILSEVSKPTFNKSSLLQGNRRILNFLILDTSSSPPSSSLPSLMTYFNSAEVIGLLMKLILLSPQLKSTLELKLFQLFDNYKFVPQEKITWLINLLEAYSIVYSLVHKDLDLSSLKLSHQI